MTGLKPMGLFKKEREQWNFVLKLRGLLKNKRGQLNCIVAGNDRAQTNGIIKKWEGAVKFYSGWKWQDENQWDD